MTLKKEYMLNLKQISYLTRADRAKQLRVRVIVTLAWLAAGILMVTCSTGWIMTVSGIAMAVTGVLFAATPLAMLVVDRNAGRQSGGSVGISERAQKVADEKAAAVHALVLKQLADAGKAPQSLVIVVFNTSWEAGGPLVLTSTIGTDGALATEIIEDDSSRYWEILYGIASPFLTETEWQVTAITAEPGQPATAQLVDDAGYWAIFAEMNKPTGEQFRDYHRVPAAAS
jgi:hypothetical protein